MKEIGKSSRIDDEVVQDQRQRDDNDLQDERQDQPMKEEVEPRRSKKGKNQEIFMDLLSGCKPLGYKWIFKKKMKADDTINKYKARLAIKGFRQQTCLYYFDTYSMRITPVKMILAIAALKNKEVHQMDVKMTFLNGDLEKVLYMNQLEGFMAPGLESKVCRLVKSLYGLRDRPVGLGAKLNLSLAGELILQDSDGSTVWTTNTTGKSVAVMNLTNIGNLVLFDIHDLVVWQSFDHPTDCLLPGQTLL
ncbi:retrotransposon protein, putative, ty1-copia subclass [Tanacetum coccineum]